MAHTLPTQRTPQRRADGGLLPLQDEVAYDAAPLRTSGRSSLLPLKDDLEGTPLRGRSSLLPLQDEVPYDADEIAEDFRWNEMREDEHTPYKANLGVNNSGSSAGTEVALPQQQQPSGELRASATPFTTLGSFVGVLDSSTPLKPLHPREEGWPDTWTSVVSQTTPQRTDSVASAASASSAGLTVATMQHHQQQYMQQHQQQRTNYPSSQPHSGHYAPSHARSHSRHHSATSWHTEADTDADTEHEEECTEAYIPASVPPPQHVMQQQQSHNNYLDIAGLSLGDAGDYTRDAPVHQTQQGGRYLQQQQQPQLQQHYAQSQSQHSQHQTGYGQPQSQFQSAQHGSHQALPTHQLLPHPQLQQQQQPLQAQARHSNEFAGGYHMSAQSNYAGPPIPQQQQHQAPVLPQHRPAMPGIQPLPPHRQPSPPPSHLHPPQHMTYPGRFGPQPHLHQQQQQQQQQQHLQQLQQTPGMWQGGGSGPSNVMSMGMGGATGTVGASSGPGSSTISVRTSSALGAQAGRTFGAHTGPVLGAPTTQVGYQQSMMAQQQQQQHHHAQQHGHGGGSYQRGQVHSQPLTPVGSFGSSGGAGPLANMGGAAGGHFSHSHSHPASPRSGAQSHPSGSGSVGGGGSLLGSSVGSGSGPGSNFLNTPLSLSPQSSPVMSPHSSPQRSSKQYAMQQQQQPQQQMHQQGQQGGAFMQAPSQQQQPPQHSLLHHHRGSGSGMSALSLSSSGSSTPTAGQASMPLMQESFHINAFYPPQQSHAPAVYPHHLHQQQQHAQQMQQQPQQAQMQHAQQSQSQQAQQGQSASMGLMQQPQQNAQPGSSPNNSRRGSSHLSVHTGAAPYVPQQQPQQGSHYFYPQSQQQQSQQSHAGGAGSMLSIKTSSSAAAGAGSSGLLPSSSAPSGPSVSSQGSVSFPPALQAPQAVLSGDSPHSKSRFKSFYKDLWSLVRAGDEGAADRAYDFGVRALRDPENERIRWKISTELADLAKRQNHVPRARYWYEKAHDLEPLASQVWIEHAKMEEECGELLHCEKLMEQGLKHCELNEALMIKALKHYERMGCPDSARAILARLRDVPLDRVWRTLLEGGLMEARLGLLPTARRIFKYLMHHVSWYGPIYWEAARVEERWGRFDAALAVVEKGLAQVPRYGPLWFMAFSLRERVSGNPDVPRAHAARALAHVSAELIWKLHFSLAEFEERLGNFDRAREAYAQSIHACPLNLRWKVWLSGARMELLSGVASRIPVARQLIARALDEVPKKMRCMVLLEAARAEEFLNDLPAARRILRQAQSESRMEWKCWLESVLLELRANRIDAAIAEAESALEVHSGTGRLWAILIQLRQKQKHALGHRLGHMPGSLKAQWAIFRLAIKSVPKSGEVWCEGARLVLNPHAPRYFNLRLAKTFLNFAIQFTPQYGDSFIEYLRLKMILEGWNIHLPEGGATDEGNMAAHTQVKNLNGATAMQAAAVVAAGEAAGGLNNSGPRDPALSNGGVSGGTAASHLKRVQQLCVNAEPNYGSSWFSCKREAHWAPVEVLEVAGGMIQQHLVANQRAYQQAILQGWYRKDTPEEAIPTVKPISVQDRLDAEAEAVAASSVHSPSPSSSSSDDSSPPSSSSSSPVSCASRMSIESSHDQDHDHEHDGLFTAATSVSPDVLQLPPSASTVSASSDSAMTAINLQLNAAGELMRTAEDAVAFSPSTLRRAAAIELGESSLLSASSSPSHSLRATPDSTLSGSGSRAGSARGSAALTSEDDEDDLQPEYQPDAEFNSLQILYPPIANMSVQERHRCLYGADPIAP